MPHVSLTILLSVNLLVCGPEASRVGARESVCLCCLIANSLMLESRHIAAKVQNLGACSCSTSRVGTVSDCTSPARIIAARSCNSLCRN